ncbi:unnamed protein product [Thelazia callipaeda]|uniref:rRNA biogenesis protein RRP36 n=1 Tax=Thelazia callipaeda TaxID=103827 RepID=A0A0N5CQ92_THECL|nr:unnamed protein product [Thelazia callipaeda]
MVIHVIDMLNRNKQRLDNEASKRGRYQISYVSKLEKNILEDGDSDKNQKPLKDVDESSDEEKLEYVKHEEHDKDSLVSDFNSEHCKAELDIVQFREEIANVPLCKAKQLQEKLGQKLFDKAFFGESSICSSSKQTARRTFTRENSKRPREVSSKIPVSKFRNVFQNEKLGRPILDPRFDDRCGEFNDYIYHNNYDFLNDIRQQEKKILIEELKRVKREGGGDLDHLKETLKNMKNREKTKEDVERRKQVIREIRHENIERMQKGLPPIYKTRAQIRQLLWEKKSEELKGGKKLEKYLHRRAKKESKRRGANISVGRINERISDASD